MLTSLIEADSQTVITLLTAHAVRVLAEYGICGPGAVMPGLGLSAEDFATEIYIEYLTGKIRVRTWPYLYTALKNNIRDKLGSSAQKTTEHVPTNPQVDSEGNVGRHLDGFPMNVPSIEDRLCEDSYKAKIRQTVQDQPPLKELVEAVFDLDLTKPGEIAEALGISASEVYVRNRKLARRLIKNGVSTVKS